MDGLPNWMHAPRIEGWYADDLDNIPELPPHTEMLHGNFVFRRFPQPVRHELHVTAVASALTEQTPPGARVVRGASIRLDQRNRFEPDLLVTTAAHDPNRTCFTPDEVLLIAEMVSPESAHWNRVVKPRKYAEAGIARYWLVEEEHCAPAVHAYELDAPTGKYTMLS
ncbi:Uma2 family endonuclease [Dactylosporangium sp. CA-152071]|uniref:Uma2 family endonuclease n=1 Tax=Dactylosporangium sp. CA-152071 TaxID=3239933 RepID=UPI003D9121C9